MPSRNQAMIRRDINRLDDCCRQYGAEHAALAAIAPLVHERAAAVNAAHQALVDALASGRKERMERDDALDKLRSADSRWRPAVLLMVPGADGAVRALPPANGTSDDAIHAVEDLRKFIAENPAVASIRKDALGELDAELASAKKELGEATVALPDEHAARDAYTAATLAANPFVVHGSEMVRAIFGRTSAQYRQFIEHSPKDHAAVEAEANSGESATASAAG